MEEDVGFLEKIRPPTLEDAGLEDCALPPDSIMEAFLKAATVVSSRSDDHDESDGDSVNDSSPGERSPVEKGGALVGDGDLSDGSAAEKEEVTTVPAAAAEEEQEKGGGGAINVDGMRGLKIGDK